MNMKVPNFKKFGRKLVEKIKKLNPRRKKKSKSDLETNKWLGKKFLRMEKRVLNDEHCSREDLARRYVIAYRNWKMAMGEIEKLEEENRRLIQDKLLSRD